MKSILAIKHSNEGVEVKPSQEISALESWQISSTLISFDQLTEDSQQEVRNFLLSANNFKPISGGSYTCHIYGEKNITVYGITFPDIP